jgi:hypothetical protein
MTPQLRDIIPRSAAAFTHITWYGMYKIWNTDGLKKMLIGDQLCDRFEQNGFTVLNDDTAIQAYDYQFIDCKVSPDIEGGLYSVDVQDTAGTARQYDSLSSMTADGKKSYQFRVIPSIEDVNYNAGST